MAKDLQQFEFGTLKRSEIKKAKYNPRIIDESNQRKLVKAIRENGLVEPLVVNKRTGNTLVSGHQRLTAADKIYRKDYDVPVAIIDVDKKTEKKLNVQLNNPSMQGDWDLSALADLSFDNDISFEDMGFDASDIDLMYDGEIDINGEFKDDEPDEEKKKTLEEIEKEKAGLEELKQQKKKARKEMQDQDVIDFYCKVVFPSNEAKRKFFKKANIPANEEYVTIDQLKRGFTD